MQQELVKSWNTAGYGVRHKAIEMGISVGAAKKMRTRYLQEQLRAWFNYIDKGTYGVYSPCKGFQIPYGSLPLILKELSLLAQQEAPRTAITEDMKIRADEFPIENVVEFDGKRLAMAFCHNDTKPSLYHSKIENKAMCFVCNKQFRPFEVLMQRDGLTWKEAIMKCL